VSGARQGNVISILSIRGYLDTLVHPRARADALTAAHHRAFMAPRLAASLVALGILPVFLALRRTPSVLDLAVLAWTIVPLSTVYFLSRTGRYESAHLLSALALTGVATLVAAYCGGIDSFAAVCLVLVPLEAAVSGSRRVAGIGALLALGGAALLIFLDNSFFFAVEGGSVTVAAAAIASASLYAAAIGFGADSVARANSRLFSLEEEQCRLLAANMSDVITRHDQNGRVLFASPNAQAVLGAPAGELRGRGLLDRVHIADRPAYLTVLANAATSNEILSFEFRMHRAAEEAIADTVRFIWIEMRCRRLDAPGEGASGAATNQVVAVLSDITRRKARKEAFVEARAEAERANAAKSRFLAVVSHELRTPLNAIIGFSEMLSNEDQLHVDSRRRQEYARLINESGHHLLSVVNDILDMSRLETGDFEITPEPFNLAAVMVSCQELLLLKAQNAGVALHCDVSPAMPDIVGDKRAVKQILINLICNAIKFTDCGGTVRLSAVVEGHQVVIAIEDTGIGIAAEDLARIGDPFFQARGSYARRHDGAGLGLSIVKGLVNLHGGDVEIRSRLGEGTRIVVRLPLDCERVATSIPSRPVVLTDAVALGRRADVAADRKALIDTSTRLEPPIRQRA
jgi:cell cycle sensor histidine kinase DivJ